MTVDVEDYFQVSAFDGCIARADWARFESRVEANTDRLLRQFADAGVCATFFILGWVADRHPDLVRRIALAGHEVASHGWDHRLVSSMTPDEFRTDVIRTRTLLQTLSGQRVLGYRAPSYSFTRDTLWAHDILADAGYRYSSSVAPVKHDRYGIPEASRWPFESRDGRLLEIPVSTRPILFRNRICGGGGWFRLYPYALTRYLISCLNRQENQPCVFYVHPWEVDAEQPRVDAAGLTARFRHYLNLARVSARLDRLMVDFRWERMDTVFAGTLSTLPEEYRQDAR